MLPAPLPPGCSENRWVNPRTPLTGPSAGRGTEASAVRARGRAATSYNWQRLRDFHKLILVPPAPVTRRLSSQAVAVP